MKRTIWYRTQQFAVLFGIGMATTASPALAGHGQSFKGLSGGANFSRSPALHVASPTLGSKVALKSTGVFNRSQGLGSPLNTGTTLSGSALNKTKLFNNSLQFKRTQGVLLSDQLKKSKLSDAVLTGPFNKLPGGSIFQPPKGPIGPIVVDPGKGMGPLGPIVVDPLSPVVGPFNPPKGPIGPIVVDPLPPVVGPIKPPIGPIGPIVVDPLPPIVDPGNPGQPTPPPAPPTTPPNCPKPPFGWPWFPGYVGNPYPYPSYPSYCSTNNVAPQPVAAAQTVDLQIAEVRRLDAGNALRGPLYRVWIANTGNGDVMQPFDVALVATMGAAPDDNAPYGVERINGLAAGQTATVDIRLPALVNRMSTDANGQAIGFSALFGAADVGMEVTESNEANNSFSQKSLASGRANAAAGVAAAVAASLSSN